MPRKLNVLQKDVYVDLIMMRTAMIHDLETRSVAIKQRRKISQPKALAGLDIKLVDMETMLQRLKDAQGGRG